MPKFLLYAFLILIVLAMIPPALIARSRAVRNDHRRIHFIQDMDNQLKFRAQHANPIFADGRAMRPPVEGTVARGALHEDDHFHRGVVNDAWAATFPRPPALPDLTPAFIRRGQDRFDIYCQPCHGAAGYGDGIVNTRAMQLTATGVNGTAWVTAKSLHEPAIREQPVGQIFNTISNGVRNMAGYASQISVEDRWAIVAWVKALQRSQHALESDVASPDALPTVDLVPEATAP